MLALIIIVVHGIYCLQEYEPIYLANYQARTSGERLNQGKSFFVVSAIWPPFSANMSPKLGWHVYLVCNEGVGRYC